MVDHETPASMDANGDGKMLPVCLSLTYADHSPLIQPRIVQLAGCDS